MHNQTFDEEDKEEGVDDEDGNEAHLLLVLIPQIEWLWPLTTLNTLHLA